MSEMTVTMSVERYNELLRKETIYDIERGLTLRNKYRTDRDSLMYGVPTREEEEAMYTSPLSNVKRDDF